jgi:hypothetical protein
LNRTCREWEYEFDRFVERGSLPNLMLIELPRDHFGEFGGSLDGTDTPDEQMADNDYALGLIVEKVARSAFADNTLIFVIEDDAQDGPDHVDTQRTIAYVIGPYVKQGAVVSKHYANPNMLRTIADVLKMEPMGLQVALADPMTEVFDKKQREWSYTAIVPEILRQTELPLPARSAANSLPSTERARRFSVPRRDAEYWTKAMAGQDFKREDNLDTVRLNRALWAGLMGENVPYPTERHGRDLSRNRAALLKAAEPVPTGRDDARGGCAGGVQRVWDPRHYRRSDGGQRPSARRLPLDPKGTTRCDRTTCRSASPRSDLPSRGS